MPERNTNVLEVLIAQMAEYGDINLILSKALRVLPAPELLKPVRNLLLRGSSPRGYRAELPDRAMESLADK